MFFVQAFKGTELTIDDQTVTTPKGSIKTVRGCRCKRSKCLKKYCECFGVGLKCGDNCICEGCQNGNEAGGGGHSSASSKKKGPKGRASPLKPNSAPSPKMQHKVVVKQKHEVVPIVHTMQFKPLPVVASAGKMLAHRKPPLSVNIPAPASQPIPVVQRDLQDFSANTSVSARHDVRHEEVSARHDVRHEVSTAWGMTPLGSASIMPPNGVDRENSGFQSFPSYYSNTPTFGSIGVQRDVCGLPLFSAGGSQSVPMWQPLPVWNEFPSAHSTLRSPGVNSWVSVGMGFADSPKGMSLVTPRSPLRSARSMVQGQATFPSPGAIFTAAEGMLPSPVRDQSVLSTMVMNEDLVHSMAREISARF